MCENQQRIQELEQELADSHQREAVLFKTLAEAKNFESQIKWRPWQVMAVGVIVPTVISVFALITAIAK